MFLMFGILLYDDFNQIIIYDLVLSHNSNHRSHFTIEPIHIFVTVNSFIHPSDIFFLAWDKEK